jgi:hypothetical protein
MKSAFHEWFISQHGERPVMLGKNDEDLMLMISAGERATAMLLAGQDWNNRYQSALHAWQAREKTTAKDK